MTDEERLAELRKDINRLKIWGEPVLEAEFLLRLFDEANARIKVRDGENDAKTRIIQQLEAKLAEAENKLRFLTGNTDQWAARNDAERRASEYKARAEGMKKWACMDPECKDREQKAKEA